MGFSPCRSDSNRQGEDTAGAEPGPGTGPAAGFGGAPFTDVDVNGGINFEEFLERMFGGGRAGKRGTAAETPPRSAAPAEDVEFGLDISLEEAFRGASRRID